MKISYFDSVRSPKAEVLTAEKFESLTNNHSVKQTCNLIAQAKDHDEQQQLKKKLPAATWQASFKGARKNNLAVPSGLFIDDFDGIDNPSALWESIKDRKDELGILLAHMTPSTHGLRIVASCRPEFNSIDECQQWLAKEIGVPHDPACKDWARASYLVPADYIFYLDARLFADEPEVVYDVKVNGSGSTVKEYGAVASPSVPPCPMGEGNSVRCFKGIALTDIAREWLMSTGGEPVQGERNDRLFKLACDLRYITDFNESTLLAVMPRYGLDEAEMRSLIHSACTTPRLNGRPKRLDAAVRKLQKDKPDDASLEVSKLKNPKFPPLPPLMKEVVGKAPKEFKEAVTLCMLPLLGTLASRLRAKGPDKKIHSPSFQVSLEGPQASGKSFMMDLAKLLLAPIDKCDDASLKLEQEYQEKARSLGSKLTYEQRMEHIGPEPKTIVRIVPAKISVSKLLMRMDNAQGLHLVTVAPEIDTVTGAVKKEFSNYTDILRMAFDNDKQGQDYMNECTFKGRPKLYYNTLFSGTPKAMRRFYPDIEDGLVSRVCFVSMPDMFGKMMPEWGDYSKKELAEVESHIARLDGVSFADGKPREEHVMDMEWLVKTMKRWQKMQIDEAVRTNDRARDTFYKRATIVGFRAGMVAWFLYGEKENNVTRRKTIKFAEWVATQMLNQHLLRFSDLQLVSNIMRWEKEYRELNDEFTREELENELARNDVRTPVKKVVSVWQMLDYVEVTESTTGENGQKKSVRFKKLKKE